MEVSPHVTKLRVLDALKLGEIWLAEGKYPNLQSARVQAQKHLNALADLGLIEKCGTRGSFYYRVKNCEADFNQPHTKAITVAIAEYLKEYPESIVHRECLLPEVGLRPDFLILLVKGGVARCLYVEIEINETNEYRTKKQNALKSHDIRPCLSKLFGYEIPHYEIVRKEG